MFLKSFLFCIYRSTTKSPLEELQTPPHAIINIFLVIYAISDTRSTELTQVLLRIVVFTLEKYPRDDNDQSDERFYEISNIVSFLILDYISPRIS